MAAPLGDELLVEEVMTGIEFCDYEQVKKIHDLAKAELRKRDEEEECKSAKS